MKRNMKFVRIPSRKAMATPTGGRARHELQRLAHLWIVLCAVSFVHHRQRNGDSDYLIRAGRMVNRRCAMASSRGRCFFPVPPPLASASNHRAYLMEALWVLLAVSGGIVNQRALRT